MIAGDFNCKEIDWKQHSTSVNENHVSTQLLECIRDCFPYQHVAEHTRFQTGEASSLLDLILTNEESMISHLKYMAGLGKSDHLQLTFNFNCYTYVNSHSFKKHHIFKGHYTELARDLESTDWEAIFDGLDLTDSWDVLTENCRAVEIPCPTCLTWSHFTLDKLKISIYLSLDKYKCINNSVFHILINYYELTACIENSVDPGSTLFTREAS